MFNGKCPVCDSRMVISSYACSACGSGVTGSFPPRVFDVLGEEEEDFVITFLICSGSIKQVEKRLRISYPTVKSRLRRIVEQLGKEVEVEATLPTVDENRVLSDLSNGRIDPQEAVRQLRGESTEGDTHGE
ncbi:MAG: DUF2089 domain-containing protein [Candidatus Delongbacteria bacterium]|nr:DUF2089 domain-containing protein [Candidatus Delongbacteria bacterium]